MEVKVKNQDLANIIGQLLQMQHEKLTLGVKNRLQKIVKELKKHYDPFNESLIDLLKSLGVEKNEKEVYPFPKGFAESAEYKELAEQENTVLIDLIDYTKVVELETTVPYDMELLKPFFENFEA